jgi:hypothetical protein
MSDCKVFRREFDAAADEGALSAAARSHATLCRACGDEARALESLRGLVRGLGKVEAPVDFDYRLRARMSASKAGGRRAPLRGWRLVYAFAPVAAAACFVVFAASLYYRPAAPTPSAETPAAVATHAQGSDAEPARGVLKPEQGVDVAAQPKVERNAGPSQRLLTAGGAHGVRRNATVRAREVAAKSALREDARRNTIVASLSTAQVISGRGPTITLEAPAEPLRMILRDERGAEKVVPMRSVSFGSQELIARQNALRQTVSTENQGVW